MTNVTNLILVLNKSILHFSFVHISYINFYFKFKNNEKHDFL